VSPSLGLGGPARRGALVVGFAGSHGQLSRFSRRRATSAPDGGHVSACGRYYGHPGAAVPDIRGIRYPIINSIPGSRGQATGWLAAAAGRLLLLFNAPRSASCPRRRAISPRMWEARLRGHCGCSRYRDGAEPIGCRRACAFTGRGVAASLLVSAVSGKEPLHGPSGGT
jgi:hypothetical protein